MKMKTRIIGLVAVWFGLGALVWTACDKIADDEMRIGPKKVVPGANEEEAIVDSITYVVVEDFTGVKCPNCPKAATKISVLQAQYGSQLIVIELHPEKSSLTVPYNEDADLRSADAQTYYESWGSPTLPAGLVNRRQAEVMDFEEWESEVAAISAEKPVVTINQIEAKLEDGTISVTASGYFREDYAESGELNMIVMVLEDGFKVRQLGSETPKEHNYPHNHVLRQSIGGAWGMKLDDVAANPKAATKFEHKVSTEVDSEWNTDNLSVVAMLCNADTKVILNAAKVKVTK